MRLLSFVLVCALAAPASAGKLDDVRDEVRDSSDSSSSSDYDYDDDDDYYDYDGNRDGSPDLLYALFWPFMLPFVATDDCYGGDYVYPWYPYATNHSIALTSTCVGPAVEVPEGQSWAVQLTADVVPQTDDILRLEANIRIQTPLRFELESGWSHFRERLSDGEVDQLTIGDMNLVIRFAQSSIAQFRAGLGLRTMVDTEGVDPGFNFTYGLDVFPVNPLVISASIDLGNLGWAGYFQGRFTFGMTLRGGELFVGWDHIQIGKVSLSGPVAGARFWF